MTSRSLKCPLNKKNLTQGATGDGEGTNSDSVGEVVVNFEEGKLRKKTLKMPVDFRGHVSLESYYMLLSKSSS